MKRIQLLFAGLFCLVAMPAMSAVSIKKAAPVATQQASAMDSAGSLVGTVLTLASGVKALNQQVDALTAECQPTSAEISFVNDAVKEWAKTGAASAEDVQRMLRRKPCAVSSGVGGYQASVEIAAMMGDGDICYDSFQGTGNDGMVWEGFPRVGMATYCDDGSRSCGKKQKSASDIYDIFNLVDFSEADYTRAEATMAGKLIAKIEKCSGAKLSQQKRALWGNFLLESVGNLGQKTNTASIMDTVSGVVGGGAGLGGLQSLGSFITSSMDK